MKKYFLRRLLLIIPTFLGITVIVFTITRFVPGGPLERILTQMQAASTAGGGQSDNKSSMSLSEEQIADLNKYYGFDRPILESYFIWLFKTLQLDLGTSSRYGEPVWDTIKSRFPISIFYGLNSMIIAYLICIPLGILKAIKHGKTIDNLTSIFVFIGYAIPSYVLGIALLLIFASHLEWFPLGGFVGDEFEELSWFEKIIDVYWHGALPLASYVAGSFAVMTFMMKNSLLDNLAADYMRTAMSKGLTFKNAVIKHSLRNSLIPLATHFGQNISFILTGSVLIETIFNIDGFGLLSYESLVERDYPVVLGILVISSLLYLIGNVISDICVVLVDPRVRLS